MQALVFAVASGSPGADRHLAALCKQLGAALKREVTPAVLPSYTALGEQIEAGGAHIVWAPPLVAVELERAGLASIALCCARGGEIGYHAALFTRHGSPIDKLADMRGCHVAWVDAHSSAGYLVPRMRIASAGFDPKTFFGRESYLGTHEKVACAVLNGEADVGATYLSLEPKTGRPLSAGWLEAGAGVNGAYIVSTAGPIPADGIVVSSRLSPAEKQQIATQLCEMPKVVPDLIGGLFRADGFLVPEAAHFDELRALSAAAAEKAS